MVLEGWAVAYRKYSQDYVRAAYCAIEHVPPLNVVMEKFGDIIEPPPIRPDMVSGFCEK